MTRPKKWKRERICRVCGVEFIPNIHNKKDCSYECSQVTHHSYVRKNPRRRLDVPGENPIEAAARRSSMAKVGLHQRTEWKIARDGPYRHPYRQIGDSREFDKEVGI